MKRWILLVVVAAFFGCQQGPTHEQFRACYKELSQYSELQRKQKFTAEDSIKLNAFLQKEEATYSLSKMTYRQMLSLSRIGNLQAVNAWLKPAMEEMANRQNDSACLLQYILYSQEGKDAPLSYERYMKILSNPVLMLSQMGMGNNVLHLASVAKMDDAQKVEFIKFLIPNITPTAHMYSFYGLTGNIWKMIRNMGDKFPEELKEQYYQKVLEAMRGALAESKDPNIHNLKSSYESFNTLHAQGKLIGSIAPEIDFLWNSEGMKLKNLADLRGKVVVLDFWATWCGPCVRAFPNVRKLQEHYKNYPVIILGVTSVQGRHVDRLNKKTIDTKGDPEKEFRLMKKFMRDQKMTWPVAFGKQGVYNPEYGVNGVPSLVILDVEGRVRHYMGNPNTAPYEEAEKIDALLKEAGLKYPKKQMEKRNYAEEEAQKAKAAAKK